MPRLAGSLEPVAKADQAKPIVLVRILDLPDRVDPDTRTSVYLTDAEEPISFFDENGNHEAYLPVGLAFDRVTADNSNSMVSFKLRIDNVSREFCSLASTVVIEGVKVQVLRAYRELLDSPDYCQLLISASIQSWRISESEIELEVTSPVSLTQKVPRRLCWTRCPWKFQGVECGFPDNVLGWHIRWWVRTSSNYKTIDQAVTPDEEKAVPFLNYEDHAVGEVLNYLNGRAEGTVIPQYSETYTLKVSRDDGIRLWIDGVLKLDKWSDGETSNTTTFPATAGVPLLVVVEFYQGTGGQKLIVEWSSASQLLELVGAIPGTVKVPAARIPSATVCDRSLESCKALFNQIRFGGFPHLTKSRDPRIIWTRS